MSTPKKIAILVEDNYQDLEVWYPYYRLIEAGHQVVVVGPQKREYKGKYGYPITVQISSDSVKADDFDGVVIPGGWAPDRMRLDSKMVGLVRDLFKQGKLVASICHGGWMLASAGVCKGKTLTSYMAIKDDVVHAGGKFVDQEVVRDGHLITSRKPDDLPAFLREILAFLA